MPVGQLGRASWQQRGNHHNLWGSAPEAKVTFAQAKAIMDNIGANLGSNTTTNANGVGMQALLKSSRRHPRALVFVWGSCFRTTDSLREHRQPVAARSHDRKRWRFAPRWAPDAGGSPVSCSLKGSVSSNRRTLGLLIARWASHSFFT